MRRTGRTFVAAVLVGSALALVAALVAGCAGPAPGGGATRPGGMRARAGWNAEPAAGADRVFVMRASETTGGRDVLQVMGVADDTGTAVWSAPAGFDARLLCADGSRVAVALSKRGASNIASRQRGSAFAAWAVHVDQPVVVLRADGSITTGSVPASSTGIVNSGAFAGDRLVLGMSGPAFHYGSTSTPLEMDGQGRVSFLTVREVQPYRIPLRAVIQLADGGLAGLFGLTGPGPSLSRVLQLRLSGDDLLPRYEGGYPATWLAQFRFEPIGPVGGGRAGTILFGRGAAGDLARVSLVSASLLENTSSVIATGAWSAGGERPSGQRPVAPLADGGYLLAVRETERLPVGTIGYTSPFTHWVLARLDVSTGARVPTQIRLRNVWRMPSGPRLGRFGEALPVRVAQDTWVYVERFGP